MFAQVYNYMKLKFDKNRKDGRTFAISLTFYVQFPFATSPNISFIVADLNVFIGLGSCFSYQPFSKNFPSNVHNRIRFISMRPSRPRLCVITETY